MPRISRRRSEPHRNEAMPKRRDAEPYDNEAHTRVHFKMGNSPDSASELTAHSSSDGVSFVLAVLEIGRLGPVGHCDGNVPKPFVHVSNPVCVDRGAHKPESWLCEGPRSHSDQYNSATTAAPEGAVGNGCKPLPELASRRAPRPQLRPCVASPIASCLVR